ncbi:MAG: hypothetical protein K5905_17955 [Roseibium sp.]|uniref:hypothetical protein n=1 Tax=Roseibium sp. TaxID=1936156 RepID=UPI00263930ED|nr:hypothetical protein [Roseibium sp.]MCV0427349.1 hypothetical protein [Roseibium sp.]
MTKFFWKLLGVGLSVLFVNTANAENDLFFKVCEDYQSGQYRDCRELNSIEFRTLGTITLHVYSELNWKVGVPRVQSDIFMRWLYQDPDGNQEIVAEHTGSSAYRWRPSKNTQTTRWHVQATVWRDKKGSFIFEAFTEPSNPEGSMVGRFVVPVEGLEG